MTPQDFIQIIIYFTFLVGLTPILGNYMYKVFTGNKHFMLPVFGWLEKLTYKTTGVNPGEATNWKSYTFGLLIAVILIVGGLTHFPALSLGPVIDHLLMNNGITF